MKYAEWLAEVPVEITGDSLWRVEAYRMALFVADLSYRDARKVAGDRLLLGAADQMLRATGSISANIAEGYSRGTGRDRARFYEYALGSARESRDWYYKLRLALGDEVATHRIDQLTQIIRLLLTMAPQQRQSKIRDDGVEYTTETGEE